LVGLMITTVKLSKKGKLTSVMEYM
jgi:hypothetical protein